MTITNTWGVVQMDTYPTFDNFTDIVFTVHWNLTATDENGNTGYVFDCVALTVDPENGYTPYADLTQAEVIGWVHDALGAAQVAAYEQNVADQIAAIVTPTVVNLPLPWTVA